MGPIKINTKGEHIHKIHNLGQHMSSKHTIIGDLKPVHSPCGYTPKTHKRPICSYKEQIKAKTKGYLAILPPMKMVFPRVSLFSVSKPKGLYTCFICPFTAAMESTSS